MGSQAPSSPDSSYDVSSLALSADASPEPGTLASSVAAQLASRLKASADFEPGSGVYAMIARPGSGRKLDPVVAQLQIADDRVVEPLDALVVETDVVHSPVAAELLALR